MGQLADRAAQLSGLRLNRRPTPPTWASTGHTRTIGEQRIDPLEKLGIIPAIPMLYWGWSEIPDQYGRRTANDNGQTPLSPDPEWRDLPPLRPTGARERGSDSGSRVPTVILVWIEDLAD